MGVRTRSSVYGASNRPGVADPYRHWDVHLAHHPARDGDGGRIFLYRSCDRWAVQGGVDVRSGKSFISNNNHCSEI